MKASLNRDQHLEFLQRPRLSYAGASGPSFWFWFSSISSKKKRQRGSASVECSSRHVQIRNIAYHWSQDQSYLTCEIMDKFLF